MCQKGYHNVSTVDIAKYAGVSTGIIYQYFQDKRDIFIDDTKDYANNIIFPMIDILEDKKISNLLIYNGFNKENIEEKVHIIIGIIDNYCHEVVYHKHDDIDYAKTKDIILDIIINILK